MQMSDLKMVCKTTTFYLEHFWRSYPYKMSSLLPAARPIHRYFNHFNNRIFFFGKLALKVVNFLGQYLKSCIFNKKIVTKKKIF